MSKQALPVLGQDGVEGCCPGLLTAPLDEGQAVELAKVFKALGDPIRLR
ncbi:transcriptional regulator, partial [Streptomyces sp. 2MCAF27]